MHFAKKRISNSSPKKTSPKKNDAMNLHYNSNTQQNNPPKFKDFCQQNFDHIAHEAIALAITEANQAYPDSELHPPHVIPAIGSWVTLQSDTPKYHNKFYLILNEAQNNAGAIYPVAVVHSFKEGGRTFTANPAYDMFMGHGPSVKSSVTFSPEKKKQYACPECKTPHDGKFPTCYYCHVDSQYKKSTFRQHPYLERKAIPHDLAEAMGYRVFGNKLIIPLEGTEGYQVILPHGAKRYAVKDGLKQAHVTVEKIELDTPMIYLCEGIATAISAHLATHEPIIAALDLNGLERNLKRLQKEHPQADITILADNDLKPGRAENPGLEKAIELAQTYNCAVAVPQTDHKADFNDLHLSHGLEVVKQQIDKASKIGPTSWAKSMHETVMGCEVVTVTRTDLAQGRYLPHDLLAPYLNSQKTMLGIKSPMGTGKTRSVLKSALAYAYANGLTFGYSAHLQNLVRNCCQELGITPHVDFDELDKLKDKPVLGFCTNGFTNKLWQPSREQDSYDVLVLDEVEQQLHAIVNGTVRDKMAVYNAMRQQVSQAKIAILMDADLTPKTMNLFAMGYSGKVVAIENPIKNWAGRKMVMADSPQLVELAHKTLLAGNRVLTACASKKVARGLSKKLSQAHPTKSIKLITQDTAKDHTDFINDPNNYLETEKPDCIIYTSVIGSGFSIDLEGYFDTCLLFGGKNLTVDATYQLIGRYRHWQRFYCDVPTTGQHRKEVSWADFRNQAIDLAELETHQGVYLDLSKFQIDRNHPFYDLVADVRYSENESRANLQANFVTKAHELGAKTTNTTPSSPHERKTTRKQLNQALQEYEHAQAKKTLELHQANPMTHDEAEKYELRRIIRGGDDYLRFRAFDYERFYSEEVTLKGLLEDDYGKRQKGIRGYERILSSRVEIEQLSHENLEEAMTLHGVDATQIRGFVIHHDLTHKLLETLGFTRDSDGLFCADGVGRFTKADLLDHEGLMAFIRDNQVAINAGGLGFTVTDNTLNEPVKFVGRVLESIGIKLIGRKNGNTRYKVIDLDNLAALNRTIKRRRLAALNPEDITPLPPQVAQIEYTEEIDGIIYAIDDQGNGITIPGATRKRKKKFQTA